MSDLIVIISQMRSGSDEAYEAHEAHEVTGNTNWEYEWGLTQTSEAGRAISQEEKSTLSALGFNRLIVILPGQLVVTKFHELGKLNDKQKRQAAGFSIEDDLAASLDDTHIAFDMAKPSGDNSDGEKSRERLAIISKEIIDAVLEDMRVSGLSPDIICADYDSFGHADIINYNGRVIRREADGLGFAVEVNLAPSVVDAEQIIPAQIDSREFLQIITEALVTGHHPINLRQGAYAKNSGGGVSQLKRSAILAASILLLFLGGNIVEGTLINRKTSVIKSQIGEIYAQIFPGSQIPKNPTLAVVRAQAQLRSGNQHTFVHLSALLARSVQTVSGVEVSSLRYDEAKGQLALSINYSSFDDVEKLKRAVAINGGLFAESGTRQGGDGLNGDAIIGLDP